MTVHVLPLPWARQLIANGSEQGPVPPYGSSEWFELPDTDRRKVAACVQAAEAWRRGETCPLAPETSGYGQRRRRLIEARQPRSGDFTGGPVQWDAVSGQ